MVLYFKLSGCLFLAFFFFSLEVLADVVHLKNGRVIQGEIEEEGKDFLVLRVPYGTIRLRSDQIDLIERQDAKDYQWDLGRAFLGQKKFEQAIEAFEKAFKADAVRGKRPLAQAHAAFANHLRHHRRQHEALTEFEKALALDPALEGIKEAIGEVQGYLGKFNGLIHQARALMAQSNWDAAIGILEEILEQSLESQKLIGQDLALCHAQRGQAAYQTQRFAESCQELERAFTLDSQLAERLEDLYAAGSISLILEDMQRGQLEAARSRLTRVLRFAPINKYALYVGGRVEEEVGNKRDAVQYYATALDQRVHHPTESLLQKLRKDLEAELKIPEKGFTFKFEALDPETFAQVMPGDVQVLKSKAFHIHHFNETLAKKASQILDANLERIRQESGLQADWTHPVLVYLHKNQQDYTKASGQPSWTGGSSKYQFTSSGEALRMEIHSWQTSPRLTKSVLPHELAHLVLHDYLGGKKFIPYAIHEGFAILMEPTFRHHYFWEFLKQRLKSDEYIPLGELLKLHEYPKEPEFLYAEGFGFFLYLVRSKGLGEVLKVLKRAQSGEEIRQGFLELMGFSTVEEMERSWRGWIKKGG